jgi:hypothetical protein
MGKKKMMQYLWMFCAGVIAFGKGRGVIRWVAAAYFFSWFAPAVLLFLSIKSEKNVKREAMIANWAEGLVTKKEVKDINTVDDLFKQLETK